MGGHRNRGPRRHPRARRDQRDFDKPLAAGNRGTTEQCAVGSDDIDDDTTRRQTDVVQQRNIGDRREA